MVFGETLMNESVWFSLINNAAVGIYRADERGNFLFVNRRFVQILGYPSPGALIFAIPNLSALLSGFEASAAALSKAPLEALFEVETKVNNVNGHPVWLSVTCRKSNGIEGTQGLEGFVIDITARKEAEGPLLESEKRFSMLVEQAGDAFFIHDYSGRILDVNRRACETLGYTRAELLTMKISDVDVEVNQKKHRPRFWERLEPGSFITFEGTQIRKSGTTFPVEVRLGRLDLGDHKLLLSLTRDITERKHSDNQLRQALAEITELKNRLEKENVHLRREIEQTFRHERIVGESTAIKKVLHEAEKVASEETYVLILGETGTGKELLARAIHNMSPRKGKPMVTVNCAALPATLIESELFGRERGAFTGSVSRQVGRFEAAHGSTIFLDEIGDLPLELQAKLLRVLQDGAFERLGSSETLMVDVRVIAATNQDLATLVSQKKFRSDLYYRLNVFPINMPSLKERKEDIPRLVWAFIREFSNTMAKTITHIPPHIMEQLQDHSWPGNVRELRNVIERAMILATDTTLTIDQFDGLAPSSDDSGNLYDMERSHIIRTLEATRWRVSGPKGAASILGLKESTLRSRMEKLKVKRPR
jgi:formate hydrogenlyase transcriptional activator